MQYFPIFIQQGMYNFTIYHVQFGFTMYNFTIYNVQFGIYSAFVYSFLNRPLKVLAENSSTEPAFTPPTGMQR